MSSTTSTGYGIGRPTGVCAATGSPIVPGQPYVAALFEPQPDSEPEAESPSEDLVRRDYSESAWSELAESPAGLFASWRAEMPEPNSAKQPMIEPGEMLDLFEQLEGQQDARRVTLRYILALLLMRKRVLVYEGTESGALRVRAWAPKNQEPPPVVEVVDPGLDESTLAEATEQIGSVMLGDDA